MTLSPEFVALWERIKPKTTYRVEFETDTLVTLAVGAIKKMEKIEVPTVTVAAGQLKVQKGGVATAAISAAQEQITTGYLCRSGHPGVSSERDGADALDAGANSQSLRTARRVLQRSAAIHGCRSPAS